VTENPVVDADEADREANGMFIWGLLFGGFFGVFILIFPLCFAVRKLNQLKEEAIRRGYARYEVVEPADGTTEFRWTAPPVDAEKKK
jgi:hypothetical protein